MNEGTAKVLVKGKCSLGYWEIFEISENKNCIRNLRDIPRKFYILQNIVGDTSESSLRIIIFQYFGHPLNTLTEHLCPLCFFEFCTLNQTQLQTSIKPCFICSLDFATVSLARLSSHDKS